MFSFVVYHLKCNWQLTACWSQEFWRCYTSVKLKICIWCFNSWKIIQEVKTKKWVKHYACFRRLFISSLISVIEFQSTKQLCGYFSLTSAPFYNETFVVRSLSTLFAFHLGVLKSSLIFRLGITFYLWILVSIKRNAIFTCIFYFYLFYFPLTTHKDKTKKIINNAIH